jgi:tetratricopeptide (TPR) repeat protein
MNSLVQVSLMGWIPFSFVLFALMGPSRGVVATYALSMVLLPPLVIDLPGLPDYNRLSAAAIGSVLGTLAFGMSRVGALRLRWFDLPPLGMTFLPFLSSITNGLGAYDGFSAALSSCLVWTIPYFMGRIYLGDPHALRGLAVGLAATGLLCTPMVLFEVGTGKLLINLIFGLSYPIGFKYGLPNPALLVGTPLQLATFMAVISVATYGLWITRATREIAGLPIGLCFGIVAGATVACHQTAALGLMILGLVLLQILTIRGPQRILTAGAVLATPLILMRSGLRATALYLIVLLGGDYFRRTNPDRLIWCLILMTPLYITLRATGLWSGALAVSIAYQFLGLERSVSLAYRFMCENLLVEKALQAPVFGWGGWGRSRVEGTYEGVSIVTDGLWIIILGQNGLVGLAAMIGSLVLPLYRFIRFYPTQTWWDPLVTPAAALGIGLQLYLLDNLLNASISPVPILISGALAALQPGQRSRATAEADPELALAERLAEAGHIEAAEAAYTRLAVTGAAPAAEAWGRLADIQRSRGRWAEAIEPAEYAVTARASLVRLRPGDAEARVALTDDAERLARCLARSGRHTDAISAWEDVVAARRQLAHESGHDPVSRAAWAGSLNDLAWLVCEHPNHALQDPERAITLAEMATGLDPDRPTFWNTLGAAHYRAGHWRAAIAALDKAIESEDDGSAVASFLLVAMAHQRLGEADLARRWLSDAEERLEVNGPIPASLRALLDEATALIGHPTPS